MPFCTILYLETVNNLLQPSTNQSGNTYFSIATGYHHTYIHRHVWLWLSVEFSRLLAAFSNHLKPVGECTFSLATSGCQAIPSWSLGLRDWDLIKILLILLYFSLFWSKKSSRMIVMCCLLFPVIYRNNRKRWKDESFSLPGLPNDTTY